MDETELNRQTQDLSYSFTLRKVTLCFAFFLLTLRYYHLFKDTVPAYSVSGHCSPDFQLLFKHCIMIVSTDNKT